jgi:hypothetical protein
MGLDMYTFITNQAPAKPVDFPQPKLLLQLHYWRKHPNLHGWMYGLYQQKGGRNPDFNYAPVMLDSADLDRLQADIEAQRLPETTGFFFGISAGGQLQRDDDLEFVEDARTALAMSLTVFYIADW